jgi:hypothetical protein
MNRGRKYLFLAVVALVIAALIPLQARADYVYQAINDALTPGPFFWPNGNNIGWYWTPATDVYLTGIQTKLTTGYTNINNNYTFTARVYTDRPSATPAGTLMGSFTFNGAAYVNGWLGGSFTSPLHLTGGTAYFLGFTGWGQALVDSSGGAGVMMAAINSGGLTSSGEEFLQGWYGTSDWDTEFTPVVTWHNGPILRLIAVNPVPLPGTLPLVLAGIGVLAAWRGRRGLHRRA